jgi:hypothetical protein
MVGDVPLPVDTSAPWPPANLSQIAADITEADAWWSGNADRLAALYGRKQATSQRRFFWSRTGTTQKPADRVHVPIAADIASVSADLLFGEDLKVTIPEAHGETPDAVAVATEERLLAIIDEAQTQTALIEGAEVCSGLGGVYLRPVWDPAVAPYPLLDVVHADRAVPEWRWGRLTAVTFWRIVATDGETVWRHLERHEPGWVMHGLYAGDRDKLGPRMPLDKLAATAGLDDEMNLTALLGRPDVLLPSYVPNARPNRRHRGTPFGRQDTAGLESLMDSLDEAMTSWIRDIRIGKSRIVVPDEFLDRGGRGAGAWFDTDREIFSPLQMDPAEAAKAGITPVTFPIRMAEHQGTVDDLVRRIATSAGYSASSLGMDGEGAAMTATEVDARTSLSNQTTAKKRRYWAPNLADLYELMLLIDAQVFNSGVVPMRPSIEFPESDDARGTAEVLNLVTLAKAASIETRVAMLHPEWEDTQVQAEVERIKAEESIATDPTGGFV